LVADGAFVPWTSNDTSGGNLPLPEGNGQFGPVLVSRPLFKSRATGHSRDAMNRPLFAGDPEVRILG